MDVIRGHHQSKNGHIPPCELRREQPIANDPFRRREVICRAGDLRLKTVGEGETFEDDTCTSCTIPAALQSKLACMYLHPVKLEQDGHVRTYSPCRWYYAAKPDRQPESIGEACTCCVQYFPRPPFKVLEMFGYWPLTAKIRETIADPSKLAGRWYSAPPPPYRPDSFKGWVMHILAIAVSNLRMRPM